MSYNIENSGPAPVQVQPRNGFGVTALVLGIVGAVFALIPVIGVIAWPLVILGLIFGVLGIVRATKGTANNKGVAIAGTALSGVGLVLCIAWAAMFGAAMSTVPPPPNVPALVPPALSGNDYMEQAIYDQIRVYGVDGTDDQLKAMVCDLRAADFDMSKIQEVGQAHGLNQSESSYVSGLAIGFPCGN